MLIVKEMCKRQLTKVKLYCRTELIQRWAQKYD